MFNKKERLTRSEFESYFKKGKKIHTTHLTAVVTPHNNLHTAVSVGKKVARKAHDRNKIRRRVYGAVYRLFKKQGSKGVFIFLTKPSFGTLTKKQQLETVQKLLDRITLAAR